MIKSKYLGVRLDNNWVVSAVELAGRYGKRKKAKGNSYRFVLTRLTSDAKCAKSLTVSHNTMVRLAKGLTTVESIESRKTACNTTYANASSYKFLN